ncbi:Uncharacterized protein FWK35_00019086 [Aphis craccivora]|uniref:Uncharacterized protein n=1 Tax=Aphis craccivora TaxID=307492 RepID=A0A6G0Y9D1_APHCR|nr:Uncharacterized protein FWK35_00019086 [Aphis craccivora]
MRNVANVKRGRKKTGSECKIRSNKEIKDLWGEEDIIQTLKGRKMG